MGLEIGRAYPLLKRQWRGHGTVKRLRWLGTKGAPDFLLLSDVEAPLFAEVKAVERAKDRIGLEPVQAYTLDMLARLRCRVCLLTWCLETRRWHIHQAPFEGRVLRCSDPVPSTEELSP